MPVSLPPKPKPFDFFGSLSSGSPTHTEAGCQLSISLFVVFTRASIGVTLFIFILLATCLWWVVSACTKDRLFVDDDVGFMGCTAVAIKRFVPGLVGFAYRI